MSFNPASLTERTLKQFVDRLLRLRKSQFCPVSSQWPPRRSQVQEEVAAVLGFASWHEAIHQVRPSPPSLPPPPEGPEVLLGDIKATKASLLASCLVGPDIPASVKEEACAFKQGLVVVGGRVGTGKTTLLSELTRHLIKTRSGRRIVTFESPPLVEDQSRLLAMSHAQRGGFPNRLTNYPPKQTHQGPSAAEIIHVQPRRPTDLFVGETTNPEALLAAITAAMTGHCVYVECQGVDVGHTLAAMVGQFEPGLGSVQALDIASCLRACVAIHPVVGLHGQRIDLFEVLVVDEAAADRLMNCHDMPGSVGLEARRILKEREMDFASVARRHHTSGIISEETVASVVDLMGA